MWISYNTGIPILFGPWKVTHDLSSKLACRMQCWCRQRELVRPVLGSSVLPATEAWLPACHHKPRVIAECELGAVGGIAMRGRCID